MGERKSTTGHTLSLLLDTPAGRAKVWKVANASPPVTYTHSNAHNFTCTSLLASPTPAVWKKNRLGGQIRTGRGVGLLRGVRSPGAPDPVKFQPLVSALRDNAPWHQTTLRANVASPHRPPRQEASTGIAMPTDAQTIAASGRATAEGVVLACLRGAASAWPEGADDGLGARVLDHCALHGVAPLVYRRLGAAPGWPDALLGELRRQAAAVALWEEQHGALLVRLLAAFDERDVGALLVKGTALAYTAYPDPALRRRADSDILIPPAARAAAAGVLTGLGFRPATQVSGEVISYQASYTATDPLGLSHDIDLHWCINNAEVLARLFVQDELAARAVPLPALGPAARAVCPVDAVMIACMHRRVHRLSPYWVEGVAHFEADRLIWLYDLHLLAGRLSAAEWRDLGARARAKGLAGICREGLARAAEAFGTALPAELDRLLAPATTPEAPEAYLRAGALGQQVMNFRALGGTGPRLRLLRELAFPPAAYMRARYAQVRPAWLPWLYARRALKGLAGRLGLGGGS